MSSALLIVRTPLQAWIASQALAAERIEKYDLLYFTQNDSSEDRYYFGELKKNSLVAEYFYAPIRRFSIIGHLNFRWQARHWFRDKAYDVIMLASIDAFIPSAIASRQSGELVTFDDGTGNFNRLSIYHVDNLSWRGKWYQYLFGASNLNLTKKRINRHYTIYPDFENIVERDRLRILNKPTALYIKSSHTSHNQKLKTYFIGGPFEEDMTRKQIYVLEKHLRTLDIDFYVRHPREKNMLDINAPTLDKQGLIAEDAILRNAQDQPIHVIGWFSTVLFNLAATAQRSTILLFSSNPQTDSMAALARRAGCEIVLI